MSPKTRTTCNWCSTFPFKRIKVKSSSGVLVSSLKGKWKQDMTKTELRVITEIHSMLVCYTAQSLHDIDSQIMSSGFPENLWAAK